MVTRRLPPGARIYAVGDVHGHADKLIALHDAIRADLKRRPAGSPFLIHLGDYIDRGPNSAGCLALLAQTPPIPGVPTINLMGNHEWMLLTALDRPSAAAAELWFENGGDMTLESWGIPIGTPVQRWREMIPTAQIAFLRGLPLNHVLGGYVFVHAGVRPGLALAEQTRMDMLWIRDEFLDWDGPLLPEAPDSVVVHGHTPTYVPVLRPNRIGIDTNAGRGGPLTCAVLDDGEPRFLQV
ncbi:MAG: serine/threonine protein phosphatase [Acetobacteraceae bacterium]|nr:serine/threonine protein phosphatase [Acetobacteraceae bacterium]